MVKREIASAVRMRKDIEVKLGVADVDELSDQRGRRRLDEELYQCWDVVDNGVFVVRWWS
jgi:hypothetical protein